VLPAATPEWAVAAGKHAHSIEKIGSNDLLFKTRM